MPPGAWAPGTPVTEDHQHLLLSGNGLPGRWARRPHFVILEVGFGLGQGFLAAWAAWRADPDRCKRLHYVATERLAPEPRALARAQATSPWPELAAALARAWPVATSNLHVLDFEHGRVQLTLALGETASRLPGLHLAADAIHLGDPDATLPLLKALGRRAAVGATLVSGRASPELLAGLRTAGFEPRDAPQAGTASALTWARHVRPATARTAPPARALHPTTAVVVGAGLAGAAVAQALARQGLSVAVFESEALPAQAASGNPAGLFHGTVNAHDGTYARLFRAAALAAAAEYRQAIDGGQVSGQVGGLLRLATADASFTALQALLQRLKLPAGYVQALDARAASDLAGVTLQRPCWYFPGGGWVAPPDWVRHALRQPGIDWRSRTLVQGIARDGSGWRLHDVQGRSLGHCDVLVLANAGDAQRLLAALGNSPWPLHETRGQVTFWSGQEGATLRLPVAGDGYVLPLPGGLLCGATRQPGDTGGETRHEDHLANLARLHSLAGLRPPAASANWRGRVGWRLHTADRLPIAGAVPAAAMPSGPRVEPLARWPRHPALFVLTALGARGLTLAPLLARLVAAQATDTPWPIERDLAEAVDPARWLVRAARQPG